MADAAYPRTKPCPRCGVRMILMTGCNGILYYVCRGDPRNHKQYLTGPLARDANVQRRRIDDGCDRAD